MNTSFLNNLREITNEDGRLVTITLIIDIISDLINDRNNHRYYSRNFLKYSGVMSYLNLIGFKQVRYSYMQCEIMRSTLI